MYHCIGSKKMWIADEAEELINDHGDPDFPEWWIDTLTGAEEKLEVVLLEADVML